MLQQTLNELRAVIEIRPLSPLLIKDGRHHEGGRKDRLCFLQQVERTPKKPRLRKQPGFGSYSDPDLSFDMAFVWRRTRDRGGEFYIPGSTIRGVVRSAAERVVGRWRPDLARQGDPAGPERGRSERWVHARRAEGKEASSAAIYAAAGPIERCFGHTALRGRWVFSDASMHDQHEAAVMVRDSVGISRHTGAAAEDIKFSFETITGGVFSGELVVTNYELWQLGLLAHTLAAIDGGSARLGYGTRRGLGRVSLRVRRLHWRWYPTAYRQPTLTDGLARIPSLAELADAVKLPGDYGWHDAETSDFTAPLIPLAATDTAGIVPTWASPISDQSDPWTSAPWPQLGPLLPAAIGDQWPQWRAEVEEVRP